MGTEEEMQGKEAQKTHSIKYKKMTSQILRKR
jgi:hypothetical protein